MWRSKFQYSTYQDGGGRSENGLIKIEVPQDVRPSHPDVDAPHVHQLLYQDLHAGIQQRKETNVIIIVKFLLLYQFRYLKPERNLRNSTSCCIMCYLLAFMGFGLKVDQIQLYISNMKDVLKIKKKTRRRLKRSRLSTLPTRFVRPGPAPSRTQSQSTESLASSSLGYDLHHSPIKSQSPINTCCVDNGENS